MIPPWLHALSILAIASGVVTSAGIAVDEIRRPQHMWIMNLVWPLTALFGGLIVVWVYLRFGRGGNEKGAPRRRASDDRPSTQSQNPFPVMVAKAALHCGSGCTLGDIVAEWLAFIFPAIAVWFGWRTIFDEKMFAVWILDFIVAFLFGIAFQYFTIKPMRHLSPGQGLMQAIKADALSLSAWQVGMYGFMAVAQFLLFRSLLGTKLEVATPEFWFMMQIAMIAGFVTSYPVNWWLLKTGIKEKM